MGWAGGGSPLPLSLLGGGSASPQAQVLALMPTLPALVSGVRVFRSVSTLPMALLPKSKKTAFHKKCKWSPTTQPLSHPQLWPWAPQWRLRLGGGPGC